MRTLNRKLSAASLVVLAGAIFSYSSHAIDFDSFTINGYSSFEFEKQTTSEGPGDPNGSLDADLLDLVFNFFPTEKTRVAADVTWEHGSASEDSRGNVALEYGFSEYSVRNWLKIRAGKFLLPFGIYNEIHTAKPSFLAVKEASSTNKTERLVSNGFRFFPRWGAGLGAKGDLALASIDIDYDFLVTNGESDDVNPFEKDNNVGKAITSRLRVKPLSWLKLGASFYRDDSMDPVYGSTTSYGAFADLNFGSLNVLAEHVYGTREDVDSAGTRSAQIQAGSFVQVAYTFESISLTPFVRYELLNPSFGVADDLGWDYTVGLNWSVDEAYMVKVENHFIEGQENAQGIPASGYNEIKLAIVVGF